MAFWQLFITHWKGIYRNQSGFFWTLIIPVGIYCALSLLPIGRFVPSQPNYSQYLLPGILALQIMQGGIYGLAYWMVDLKSRGVIKRFLVAPVPVASLLSSLVASRIAVMFLQAVVMTFVGMAFFKVPFYWNIISILLFVCLGGAIFLIIGLLISRFADTYEAAAPLTTAIGMPLTFLGNIFYPIDALPGALLAVAKLLPITYLADALRILYSQPFQFNLIAKDLVILLIWLAVVTVLALWKFRLEE